MLSSLLAVAALAEPARVALVVGANRAPPGRATLRYAHDDASAVAQVLVDVGGFSRQDVHVLYDPSPDAVLDALRAIHATDLAVFYYSGHADDGELFPSGGSLGIDAVRSALAAVDAPVRVGVLDACRGGEWTGAKGLVPVEEFAIPTPPGEGVAWIAASSGREDAHESGAIGGSIFTKEWASGLRGPADTDADGAVTLEESFAYARIATVRASTAEIGRAQHPSFHYDLRGRDALVLADLRAASAPLVVQAALATVTVHSLAVGAPVAELPPRQEAWRLVLPPGHYLLRRTIDGHAEVAEVTLVAGRETAIASDAFGPAPDGWLVASKGDGPRFTEQLAPRPGQVVAQLGLGTVASTWHEPGAPDMRDLAPFTGWYLPEGFVALDVGLTKRITLDVLGPGIGVRFGPADQANGTLTAGMSRLSIRQVVLDFGLNGAVRAPLGEDLTLHLTATADRVVRIGSYLPTPGLYELATGVALHAGPSVSVYPSLGGGWGKLDEVAYLSIGSVLREGYRRLPLVRIHVTNGVSIDGHASIDWAPATGSVDETLLIGFTLASRKGLSQ